MAKQAVAVKPQVEEVYELQIEGTLYKIPADRVSSVEGLVGALKIRVANDKLANPLKYTKLNDRVIRLNGKRITVPELMSWVGKVKQAYEIVYIDGSAEALAVRDEITTRLKAGMKVPLTFKQISEKKFDEIIIKAVGLDKPAEVIGADLHAALGM